MPAQSDSPKNVPVHEPVAPRESSRPSTSSDFDVVADVAVVGSGAAGLASALFSSWLGNDVIVLEKAPGLGGTTLKSSFIYWAPNNGPMQELGIADELEDYLDYAARTARPEKYDPKSPTKGQSDAEYARFIAVYESAWPAVKLLHDKGALRYRHTTEWRDYWANLPQCKTPAGRTFAPDGSDDVAGDGGLVAVTSMVRAADEAGIQIRTGHRVQRVVVDGVAVVGVEATTVDGQTIRVGARKAVIFGSGGYAHDAELRENFLSVPIVHGCSALTNEGDFVRIGAAAGAQLRNMQYAWYGPVVLERALRREPGFYVSFFTAGDSMICVNRRGVRCVNEKLPYNELVQAMADWDVRNSEYPNWPLIQIWDGHAQAGSGADVWGNAIVPEDADQSHMIKADTLEDLAVGIRQRLDGLNAHVGSAQLDDDFLTNLRSTVARWNDMARAGVDADFGRGDREIERGQFAGPVAEEPDKQNPVMWPIADTGPYYATLIVPGVLDTKGGPKTSPSAQVLDDMDEPIPGLYGVGNCVAGVTGRAYWSGGATLGPMLAFALRAAEAANEEPVRELQLLQSEDSR